MCILCVRVRINKRSFELFCVWINIADIELQPEYTVGIFPVLRTQRHWGGGGGGYIQKQLAGLYMNFSIESRARMRKIISAEKEPGPSQTGSNTTNWMMDPVSLAHSVIRNLTCLMLFTV